PVADDLDQTVRALVNPLLPLGQHPSLRQFVATMLHVLSEEIKKSDRNENRESFMLYLLEPGHGLRHGLRSLAYTNWLRTNGSPQHDDLGRAEVLLAVFHDYASHLGRGGHMVKSGAFLEKFCGTTSHRQDAAKIASLLMKYAGKRHG